MTSIKKEYSDRVEYLNESGQYHREDGPAIEYNDGHKSWYINGKRHREDGPAVEWNDGYKRWYLNNRRYSEQEYYPVIINIKLKRILDL